jgi:hypothetical protein
VTLHGQAQTIRHLAPVLSAQPHGSEAVARQSPVDVCSYFSCIANFDNGTGYMTQCNDGMYSMSGVHHRPVEAITADDIVERDAFWRPPGPEAIPSARKPR